MNAIQRPSRLAENAVVNVPWLTVVTAEPAAWLTRVMAPVERLNRKRWIPGEGFTWPGTSPGAELRKAMELPSALTSGSKPPAAWPVAAVRLTREMPEVSRSNRKMSVMPFASTAPVSTSPASLTNATQRPSWLSAVEGRTAMAPPAAVSGVPLRREARALVPAARSYRKTSLLPLSSTTPAARSRARLKKATREPSALTRVRIDSALPVVVADPLAWLTRTFVPATRS